jgi:hypothetical protein
MRSEFWCYFLYAPLICVYFELKNPLSFYNFKLCYTIPQHRVGLQASNQQCGSPTLGHTGDVGKRASGLVDQVCGSDPLRKEKCFGFFISAFPNTQKRN